MSSAPGNILLLSLDRRYLRIFDIWMRFFHRAGAEIELAVIAFDREAREHLKRRQIACQVVGGRGRTEGLRGISPYRLEVLREYLRSGHIVVQSDLDALWFRNWLGEMRPGEYDLEMSVGYGSWPPSAMERWGFNLCCGFSVFHPTRSSLALLDEWIPLARKLKSDQASLNGILLDAGLEWAPDANGGANGRTQALDLRVRAFDYSIVSRRTNAELQDPERLCVFHPHLEIRGSQGARIRRLREYIDLLGRDWPGGVASSRRAEFRSLVGAEGRGWGVGWTVSAFHLIRERLLWPGRQDRPGRTTDALAEDASH